ncbi:MAG TPA: hypothetical protein DCY26_10450, partial [Hyphomonas sp.]|nr:hypothetical protein [Hyphomonas sp.]
MMIGPAPITRMEEISVRFGMGDLLSVGANGCPIAGSRAEEQGASVRQLRLEQSARILFLCRLRRIRRWGDHHEP